MTKIFIIHGAYGNPSENWIPWLKNHIEELGHTVFVPTFPTPKNQNLQAWLDAFEDYLHLIDSDTVLIGHSIGAAFVLSILEKIKEPVKASFLVAGFVSPLGKEEFDTINKTFTEKTFDWMRIKKNCKRFCVFASNNDPYVKLEKTQELAQKLDTKVILVENAGHFNKAAGYITFPLLHYKLLEAI